MMVSIYVTSLWPKSTCYVYDG